MKIIIGKPVHFVTFVIGIRMTHDVLRMSGVFRMVAIVLIVSVKKGIKKKFENIFFLELGDTIDTINT